MLIYIEKSKPCGTFKCVYAIKEGVVYPPLNVPHNYRDYNPIILGIENVNKRGFKMIDEIIKEIDTMKKYESISPKLYGTAWLENSGDSYVYTKDYNHPLLDDKKEYTVFFMMEKCVIMSSCIDNNNIDIADTIVKFLTELVDIHKMFFIDIKLANMCCSPSSVNHFRLIDLDPSYIIEIVDKSNEVRYVDIMLIIFLLNISYSRDVSEITLGKKLLQKIQLELSIPLQSYINKVVTNANDHNYISTKEFNALYMIGHYAFGREKNISYSNLVDQIEKRFNIIWNGLGKGS